MTVKKSVKIPIFVLAMYRPPPAKKRDTNFPGVPQNLDKVAAVEFLERLVTQYKLNPTIVLHDDDSEAIKHMREMNSNLMKKGINLVKCACDGNECQQIISVQDKKGKVVTKVQKRGSKGRRQNKVDDGVEINWVYCNNGHICKGIREVLCVRHGCGHFGQELLLLGKQIYMKQAWRIF